MKEAAALDLVPAVLKIVFMLYFILLVPQQRDKHTSVLLFLSSPSSSFSALQSKHTPIFDYSRVEIAVYQAFSGELCTDLGIFHFSEALSDLGR